MKIIFSDDQDEVKVPKEAVALLKQGLQAVARLHKLSAKTEVSVSLVNDEVIHVLNKDYRGIDRPTDVLSFALDEAEEPQEIGGPETTGTDSTVNWCIWGYTACCIFSDTII